VRRAARRVQTTASTVIGDPYDTQDAGGEQGGAGGERHRRGSTVDEVTPPAKAG
jgi:hypothetical protein